MNTNYKSIILAIGLFLALSAAAKAAPSDLDLSFGNGGIVITPFTQYSDQISSIQVQPDGKIVVSGYSYDYDYWCDCDYDVSGFIARYNSSGTLDASFGSNGKIIIGGYYEHVGAKTLLQLDGKIISMGERITVSGGLITGADFTVFRYNSNGTPDASFGIGGKVFTRVGTANRSYSHDVLLQPDGKIVVMGLLLWDENPQRSKFGIVRYNADGSLDNSFGTGGEIVTDNFFDGSSTPGWMLLQPDGKIDLGGEFQQRNQAGYYISYSILVRYNPDGSLDSGFGANGKVIRALPGYGTGLHAVLQPDGKIVVTGDGRDLYFGKEITRFNADGSVDASFATNGSFNTEIGLFGNNIALQPDGKIVAFGGSSFAALRLNPNGAPDTSFGANGRVITPVGTNNASFGLAVALQPDGKILAGGVSNYSDGLGDAAIVRYNGGTPVTQTAKYDFDGDGKSDVSVFRPSNGSWYLLNSTSGFTATQFGLSTDKIVPADYDGDGKTDIAVYRNGTWYLQRSRDGFIGFAFGAATDIPAPADYDGDGKAEIAVFRPSDGEWYIYNPVNNQFTAVQFGQNGDIPVAADYDGDGKADIAVYRNGTWYIQRSQLGFTGMAFGLGSDLPVQADYDGDGKTDVAVFRPSNGTWYLQRSQLGFTGIAFGLITDLPVPADYDGDGKTDIAVTRRLDGIIWYQLRSTLGFNAIQFGDNRDTPIPIGSLVDGCGGCWDY